MRCFTFTTGSFRFNFKEFIVRKLGDFPLNPTKEIYKLVDSLEGKAVIKLPDGQQIEVLPDPRSKN